MTVPSPEWKALRARYAALIQQFGDGWTAGKADQMAAVFTEAGVFQPDPFEQSVRGRAAIHDYWKSVPKEQAEVVFRFGEIYAAGPWFATEFKCTFRRRRTGDLMDLRGSLFCETDGDAISEMRMYWHRRQTGPGR